MAEQIINEVLYFVNSHFGSVPNDSIATVIASFYGENDLVNAKLNIFDACVKFITDGSVPRNIARKGDNKKRSDADDILKYFMFLDEHKITNILFLSRDCRKVPLINPSQVDLCFLLETIDDLKRKVDSLSGLKKQVEDLGEAMSNLTKKPPTASIASATPSVGSNSTKNNMTYASRVALPYASSIGMRNDDNLRVNLQPLQTKSLMASKSQQEKSRPKPVVGSKSSGAGIGSVFRASQQPKEFHLYIGNLDVNASEEGIREFLLDNNIAIHLLSCEIVKSSRTSNLRAVAAHAVIDRRDKDLAFEADSWPEGVVIRPWRQPRRQQQHQYRDPWDV